MEGNYSSDYYFPVQKLDALYPSQKVWTVRTVCCILFFRQSCLLLSLLMNSGFKKLSFIKNYFLSLTQAVLIPVRHRYYADKIAKGRILKKFGYNDRIFSEGLLPRLPDAKRLPMPVYRPANAWTKEKAYFGQNDYIDILGGKRLKPSNVAYDVPSWLRGRRGNEMSLLILKRKIFCNTQFALDHPTAMKNISKRIRYLYKFLNRKTKTSLTWKQ